MKLLVVASMLFAAALAPSALAQSETTQSLRDAAIADLADHYRHVERRELLPSRIPQVSLYGAATTYTADGSALSLCRMSVLHLDYYVSSGDGRAASHVDPARMLTDVHDETAFRIVPAAADCAAENPTDLWFRITEGETWNAEAVLRIATLAIGLIEASKNGVPDYQGLDMRTLEQATSAEALRALRTEYAGRIGRLAYSACEQDENSFCQQAEVEFGALGPLTRVNLTIRVARARGGPVWIEAATIRNTFSAIP
jgi:hypothetical protein